VTRLNCNLDASRPCSNPREVIDVLDHVLDKGIVIAAWVHVAFAGISLSTVEARVLSRH